MHRTQPGFAAGLVTFACLITGVHPAITFPGPITVMSPYEVRADSVKFEHWIKIGSPNFTVYTDASAAEATRVLREFEMLHFGGQSLFGRKAAHFSPTLLILPTARSDWRSLEEKGSGIEWKSAAAAAGGEIVPVLVAQYDWQDQGLSIMRAVFARVDMRAMAIAGPFWFEHGFGAYYETAAFDGNRLTLGQANPRMFALEQAAWIPWGRFFEVNSSSPEFTREKKVPVFDGQSALFTQYLFSQSDRVWTKRLVAWLDYLRSGEPPTEAQFAAIFGQDWKKWQSTMRGYLDGGSYTAFQLRLPPEVAHCAVTKYPLPTQEVRELFILTQTLLQRVPESETSLDALLNKGLRSESLRELLVEACLEWQHTDAALKNVRQLIAAGSTNSHVYRVGDALLTGDDGPFSLDTRYGAELKEVRAWDRRGLELEPLDADLANAMAVNEAGAPVVDQQSISTIEDCYMKIRGREPTDEAITALTVALWRIGDAKTARDLAAKLRDDPQVHKHYREIAAELLQRLPEPPR